MYCCREPLQHLFSVLLHTFLKNNRHFCPKKQVNKQKEILVSCHQKTILLTTIFHYYHNDSNNMKLNMHNISNLQYLICQLNFLRKCYNIQCYRSGAPSTRRGHGPISASPQEAIRMMTGLGHPSFLRQAEKAGEVQPREGSRETFQWPSST